MSVEERLRAGLARNATSLVVPVESRLAQVEVRVRRRSQRRLATRVIVMAVVLVLGVATGPDLLDTIDGLGRADQPAAPAPAPARDLLDSFTRTVSDADPLIAEAGLRGVWTVTFDAAGTMQVVAPEGYPGVVSGVLYEVEIDRLRTNVFEQDLCSGTAPGAYRWLRSGDTLVLAVVDDACGERAVVLAGGPWEVLP